MILYYKFKNFGSFKNEQIFSLKPGKVTSRFLDNVTIVHPKLKTSKIAVIAGENAGGKTCFIKSIEFFKFLLVDNELKSKYSLKNLCFNGEDSTPQFFEISVSASEYIYTYKLEIDKFSQISEMLKVRKLGQPQNMDEKVFDYNRIKIDIEKEELNSYGEYYFNEKFINKKAFPLIQVLCRKDIPRVGLIINLLATFEVGIVEPFISWVKDGLIVERPNSYVLNIYKEMLKDKQDIDIMKKDGFFEIFRLVDPTITKLRVDEKDPFNDTIIERKLNDGKILKLKVKNDSTGVNEFLAWAIQIWKVIYKDATLVADEMDRVLNVVLASKVLNYIKGSDHKGQFIFSTHNVMHLNTVDFMKEQIFFVNKDSESLTSEIYPLSDFKDYRYEFPEVYKLYLKGILGAVPND